jgi:hypothetical protein
VYLKRLFEILNEEDQFAAGFLQIISQKTAPDRATFLSVDIYILFLA